MFLVIKSDTVMVWIVNALQKPHGEGLVPSPWCWCYWEIVEGRA
jgi:hypothetical protein